MDKNYTCNRIHIIDDVLLCHENVHLQRKDADGFIAKQVYDPECNITCNLLTINNAKVMLNWANIDAKMLICDNQNIDMLGYNTSIMAIYVGGRTISCMGNNLLLINKAIECFPNLLFIRVSEEANIQKYIDMGLIVMLTFFIHASGSISNHDNIHISSKNEYFNWIVEFSDIHKINYKCCYGDRYVFYMNKCIREFMSLFLQELGSKLIKNANK
jgi:hypothetical protein